MPVSLLQEIKGCSLHNQWRIQGRGLGGPGPPLFLDHTEAQRAENIVFGDRPPNPYRLDPALTMSSLLVAPRRC